MPIFKARVADDGSVVLPAELRERLEIKPGSEVEFFLTIDGQVHFHCETDRFSDFGTPIPNPPISLREMDDRISDSLADKFAATSPRSPLRKPAAE